MMADADPDTVLDELAEEFVARTRSGEQPSITEYAQRHPEHAADIREIFPLLSAMESTKTEQPLAGTQVGPYEIVREIGRGGMGVVYEAVQTELGRRVALKILPVQATLDARFLERFRLEAQAAAKLEHSNIVPVIGYGTDGDLHYYSMQYIEGRGLDQVIAETQAQANQGQETRGRDDYRRIARIGLQLARAMAHAHAQGILHRDLKPTNVLLDGQEHAWITDFGLCYQTDSEGLTRTGDVLGTFRYMPPERFSGVSDAGGDIYGIGITLYEMLTRKRAYDAEDAAVLAAQIPAEGPPPPRALEPRIPPELDLIVRTAMAHDPAQRYATADALAHDLEAFLADQPIAARAPTLGYLIHKAIARHRTLAATIGLALALLIGSTVWYVRDLQRKEDLARRGQYAASISAAAAALRASDVHRATALLSEAPEKLRNWEWRHLHSRLHTELRAFSSLPTRVSALAISRDGRFLATTFDKRLLVHDYESGELLKTLELEAQATSVRWSPDHNVIVVGRWVGLEAWSWPEAERLYAVPTGNHRWMGFTRAGAEILAGVVEGFVVRYDTRTGAERGRHALPQRMIGYAADDPWSARRVAIGLATGRVQLLDLEQDTILWNDDESRSRAPHLGFVSDAELAGAVDGKVLIWDASTGEVHRTLGIGGRVGPIVRDPLGTRLLLHSDAGLLALDPTSATQLRVLSGRVTGRSSAVHPDGRRVVLGAQSGLLHEWFLGDGGDPLQLERHMDDIITMDIHPDGSRAVSGGFGGAIRMWDLDAGEMARVWLSHRDQLECLRYTLDGELLAAADLSGEIQLRSRGAKHPHVRWNAGPRGAIRIAFLPGRRGLVTFSRDGRLAVWSLEDGSLLRETVGSGGWGDYDRGFPVLVASRDGRFLACAQPGGGIRVFSAAQLELVSTLTGHRRPITGLAFHPRAELLASAAQDRALHLWNVRSGTRHVTHEPRESELARDMGFSAIAFSPDGSRLATGSFTGALTLWDASSLRPITSLDTGRWISKLQFGPEGTRLITAHAAGALRIWDSATVASRVPSYEAAARAHAGARPLVTQLLSAHRTPDAALDALEHRADLSQEVKEAAVRMLHHQRGTHEGFIARLFEGLVPTGRNAERLGVDRALAEGLWRASRHQNRPDPRSDTLLGLAYLRTDAPMNALAVFARIAARNEKRAPHLYAIDLAVATLAHRALEQGEEAQTHLKRLETLLAEQPSLRDKRVEALLAEIRGR